MQMFFTFLLKSKKRWPRKKSPTREYQSLKKSLDGETLISRLRVVPLSLVVRRARRERNLREKSGRARSWGREEGSRAAIFSSRVSFASSCEHELRSNNFFSAISNDNYTECNTIQGVILSITNFGIKNVFWEVLLSENICSAFQNCWKLCEILRKKPLKRA